MKILNYIDESFESCLLDYLRDNADEICSDHESGYVVSPEDVEERSFKLNCLGNPDEYAVICSPVSLEADAECVSVKLFYDTENDRILTAEELYQKLKGSVSVETVYLTDEWDEVHTEFPEYPTEHFRDTDILCYEVDIADFWDGFIDFVTAKRIVPEDRIVPVEGVKDEEEKEL